MSIQFSGVSKIYNSHAKPFTALQPCSFTIEQGGFVSIIGKSGSGKSSLLNLMAGIDSPTSGTIKVAGTDINSLINSNLDAWRGKNIGLVFQFFQLIPSLTVLENILIAMEFCNLVPRKKRSSRALALLEEVDLLDKADNFPSVLSGGEQQRVAIARALANDASIILGDEPTGNLDSKNTQRIYSLLCELHARGKTIVLVSHDPNISTYSQRTIELKDGVIIRDTNNKPSLAQSATLTEVNNA